MVYHQITQCVKRHITQEAIVQLACTTRQMQGIVGRV